MRIQVGGNPGLEDPESGTGHLQRAIKLCISHGGEVVCILVEAPGGLRGTGGAWGLLIRAWE